MEAKKKSTFIFVVFSRIEFKLEIHIKLNSRTKLANEQSPVLNNYASFGKDND